MAINIRKTTLTTLGDAILTDYNGSVDFRFVYTGDGELELSVLHYGDQIVCEVKEY
jgi:hypothetical protein